MPQDGKRRSARIPKQIAITLVGSDIEGRVFSESTKTVVLSRHGAGIMSQYKLSAEQELVLRSEESHKEIEARVVGQIGSDGDMHIYGIAFLDAQINFWGLDFPSLSETEKQASQTLLECASCRSREMADHSDLASDVMAVNQSIVRYCRKCGTSTLWKEAVSDPAQSSDEDGPPASPGPSRKTGLSAPSKAWRPPDLSDWPERQDSAPEQPSGFAEPAWTPSENPSSASADPSTLEPVMGRGSAETADARAPAASIPATGPATRSTTTGPATSVASKDRENRRKHVRTRVNFKACVRRPGMADDVVACEDMSRGGLRFKSSKKYFDKMLIDVAVPYSPGEAIFVPAQIVYVQELPEQSLYRCGVMYLRSGK
jgi:PilZ domain